MEVYIQKKINPFTFIFNYRTIGYNFEYTINIYKRFIHHRTHRISEMAKITNASEANIK